MPDYIQDPNNSKKQIPGPKPDNAYDRAGTITNCAFTKQPNSVLVTSAIQDRVGFFFGSSASYAEFNSIHSGANAQGGVPSEGMTSASQYIPMLSASATGTKLNIHPSAVSASAEDITKIMFIYKGGLDGSGRP